MSNLVNSNTISYQLQTISATPVLVVGIPVPQNNGTFVMVSFFALKNDYTQVAGGTAFATFFRTTGDVSRSSSGSSGITQSVQGNFAGSEPYIDIVANSSTETADVQMVGKASTTINWIVKIEYYIFNP